MPAAILARRHRPDRSRPGFTLVETLLVVAIIALVLSSVAVSLHAMFQVDRRLRDDLSHSMSLPRLALQLRKDAHLARSAATPPGTAGSARLILLLTDGREVSYESKGARMVRTVRRQDEKLGHEVYRLKASRLHWELSDDARLLRLRIERDLGAIKDARDSRSVAIVESAVGLSLGEPRTRSSAPERGERL